MSVQKESNELFPSKVENLEWWVIDKENVKWGFYIDEAIQKKIDIRLSQSILLEESDETIRCFVFLWWNSLTESGKYAKDIRKIMSFDYKECQTESELYPKRKGN